LDQHHGFVLTRHWRDTPQGTEVEFWLATDDGPRLVQLPLQPSVAFFPADRHEQVASLLRSERDVELRALDLRDFQHRPVMGLYCWQHHQLLRAGKLLKRAGVPVFEADVRPPQRYMMERFITAPARFCGTPDGRGVVRHARMRPAPTYRPRLRLASLDKQVWQGREAAKREGNKPLSQALKTIMNSFYGVLGTRGCRFADPRLTSSITLRGHEIMRKTRELIEAEGWRVIYGDTDSTFVWLGSV
jgi:DNA polymerase elongation subunit (family B)